MNLFLDFLFPPRCYDCGRVGEYICTVCAKKVVFLNQRCPECDRAALDGMTHPGCRKPWGLDGLTTVFQNTGVVKKVIKAIKYRFVSDAAKSLVDLIPDELLQRFPFLGGSPVLYPIPLHHDRFKWRGFNQAEKLGQILAKRLSIEMVGGLLVRKAKRIPQADIEKRIDRILNAKGIFQLNKLSTLNSQLSILLFDDIWTTGATMKEATQVLKRGGVAKVWGMTVAR